MTAGRAPFVELGLASCFSFLRGASDAAELVLTASVQGYDAIGIADLNTLAGVVRLHAEARKAGLRPVIGCRLILANDETFLAYPKDRGCLWPAFPVAFKRQDAGSARELAEEGRLRSDARRPGCRRN